ncbi:GNAT family N-acetyltransferase [Albimonas sp. CAU 1670]|uniref:GNAT family N-acetyltransferase n=1 Tax=Albimonas sp. CAU 1670 TaxID=3032599 RepID=UPI0023D9D8FA|nr:GNAT family N-acetyltransferase [Albimonas sp. CAU 1670]MDF2231047.1 GNAT family N-acetyltransferase [Albimonas sp. CAU 1670]
MEHVALHKTPGDVPPLQALRRAGPEDVDRIYEHLLRLSAGDRSLRFCGAVREPTLRRQAENVAAGYPAGLIACSFEPGEPVRGMIEIARIGAWAEVALSVETDWRGAGLAPAMMVAAARWARLRGVHVLEALTLPENGAMRGLGRKLGARSVVDDGMIRQKFDVDVLLRDEPALPAVEVGAHPVGPVAHLASVTNHRPADLHRAAA